MLVFKQLEIFIPVLDSQLHFLNLKKKTNNMLIGMSFGGRLLKQFLQIGCGNIENLHKLCG